MERRTRNQEILETPLFVDGWPVTVAELERHLTGLVDDVRDSGECQRCTVSFAAPPEEDGEAIQEALSDSMAAMIASHNQHVIGFVAELHEPDVRQQSLKLSRMKLYSFELTIERTVPAFDPPPATTDTKRYRSFNKQVEQLREDPETLRTEIKGPTKEIREEGALL